MAFRSLIDVLLVLCATVPFVSGKLTWYAGHGAYLGKFYSGDAKGYAVVVNLLAKDTLEVSATVTNFAPTAEYLAGVYVGTCADAKSGEEFDSKKVGDSWLSIKTDEAGHGLVAESLVASFQPKILNKNGLSIVVYNTPKAKSGKRSIGQKFFCFDVTPPVKSRKLSFGFSNVGSNEEQVGLSWGKYAVSGKKKEGRTKLSAKLCGFQKRQSYTVSVNDQRCSNSTNSAGKPYFMDPACIADGEGCNEEYFFRQTVTEESDETEDMPGSEGDTFCMRFEPGMKSPARADAQSLAVYQADDTSEALSCWNLYK